MRLSNPQCGLPIAFATVALLVMPVRAAELYSNVLLNSDFETADGTNAAFWTAFGNCYWYHFDHARSGSRAMCAWGNWWPTNDWNASGVWQAAPAEPGQIWEGAIWAYAPSSFQGQARAQLELHFYNAATQWLGKAISIIKLTSTSPTQEWIKITARGRAPHHAASVRPVPMFIQSPAFEDGAVWFDDCALYLVPTTSLHFAGREWRVLDIYSNPGENYYSTNCVELDGNGWLHMHLYHADDIWFCPMIELPEQLGFGEYRWYLVGRPDLLDSNLVAGLFIYAPEESYETNQVEIDIEISHGLPGTETNCLLYTIQPYTIPGNGYQHPMVLTGEMTTHSFYWRPDRVDFRSYYGHTPEPVDTNCYIAGWRFVGRGIPIETNEKTIFNLWLFETNAPTGTDHVEIVIRDFAFTPFTGFITNDDFNDGVTAAFWKVIGDTGSTVSEADGRLSTAPAGDLQAAGYSSAECIRRNERGTRYVFSGILEDVSVSTPRNGEDVRAILSFASTNDPLASPAALSLVGAYDSADDSLTVSFHAKTDTVNSYGPSFFEGRITDLHDHLNSDGGVELRMEIAPSNYLVRIRTPQGSPLAFTTNSGSSSGPLDVGEHINFGHLVIGAQNSYVLSSGRVQWDDVALGISSQADAVALSATVVSADSIIIRAPAVFDSRTYLQKSTNLRAPFGTVATCSPVRTFEAAWTDTLDGTCGFYRTRTE